MIWRECCQCFVSLTFKCLKVLCLARALRGRGRIGVFWSIGRAGDMMLLCLMCVVRTIPLIEHLLKFYLKLSKKEYLLPFIEGLENLGRPSTVTFPVELMEQGLGLVLSGLSNTLATQTNLDWVWPYWLERQQH